MFGKFRNRYMSGLPQLVGPVSPPILHPQPPYSISGNNSGRPSNRHLPDKFSYSRPSFLQLLTLDELKASADHNVRPIIVPRDISVLPWNTGYAECVNSGKSEWNEDQAQFCRQVLSHPLKEHPDLPYIYFGIFDGHAGYGAALAAANQFHHILHEKLVDIIDMLMPRQEILQRKPDFPHPINFQRTVTKDELIIGALESAFVDMDALLAEDRSKYRNAGGCTALVALFIYGKMFVANAGDSRAVLCQRISSEVLRTHQMNCGMGDEEKQNGETSNGESEPISKHQDKKHMHIFPIPFSYDHTPDTERPRLMSTAKLNPVLMGGEYVAMEYAKRPVVKDLGQRILYRQGTMKGWAYKTLTHEDLKMPIVTGEGKRSRLLGTIGVTRGFGDHDLRALGSGLPIKPFLSPHPDVIYRDLSKVISIMDDNNQDGDYGILIMATDGLWDVADTESVSMTVFNTLSKYPTEKHRYTMVAQELVAKSRGRINNSGHWRLADSKAAATVDDISVLVIPVYQYYREYLDWERKCREDAERKRKEQIAAAEEAERKLKEASFAAALAEEVKENGSTGSEGADEENDEENDDNDNETEIKDSETEKENKININESEALNDINKKLQEINTEIPSDLDINESNCDIDDVEFNVEKSITAVTNDKNNFNADNNANNSS
ncbi:protein phosphatase 1J [Condylostylus longicornis]|uniref:protein phosphatase 1J n=1 Tax=Condylostylus longicornis TaxID=2530218 RepID=UPI00244DF57E|nr:protein phosphatase 1J [Condylostylus longicornis]